MNDWRAIDGPGWRRLLADAGVQAAQVGALARYLLLLARWEGAVDLLGRVGAASLIREHVLEALAGAALAPESGTLLDVGSGNGFPAIPLLLSRPGLRGVLLEPRERRWAFLREAVRELGLGAEVRRERVAEHRGTAYDALTVRAVEASAWHDAATALLRPGGLLLWWTTRRNASALRLAGLEPVLTSALPVPERGVIAVWRRCST